MKVICRKINFEEVLENKGVVEIAVPAGAIVLRALEVPVVGQVIYFGMRRNLGKEMKIKFQLITTDEEIKKDPKYSYAYRGTVTEYIYSKKYDGLKIFHVFEMIRGK